MVGGIHKTIVEVAGRKALIDCGNKFGGCIVAIRNNNRFRFLKMFGVIVAFIQVNHGEVHVVVSKIAGELVDGWREIDRSKFHFNHFGEFHWELYLKFGVSSFGTRRRKTSINIEGARHDARVEWIYGSGEVFAILGIYEGCCGADNKILFSSKGAIVGSAAAIWIGVLEFIKSMCFAGKMGSLLRHTRNGCGSNRRNTFRINEACFGGLHEFNKVALHARIHMTAIKELVAYFGFTELDCGCSGRRVLEKTINIINAVVVYI